MSSIEPIGQMARSSELSCIPARDNDCAGTHFLRETRLTAIIGGEFAMSRPCTLDGGVPGGSIMISAVSTADWDNTAGCISMGTSVLVLRVGESSR